MHIHALLLKLVLLDLSSQAIPEVDVDAAVAVETAAEGEEAVVPLTASRKERLLQAIEAVYRVSARADNAVDWLYPSLCCCTNNMRIIFLPRFDCGGGSLVSDCVNTQVHNTLFVCSVG
jgi:hypothetical protein